MAEGLEARNNGGEWTTGSIPRRGGKVLQRDRRLDERNGEETTEAIETVVIVVESD
jgi:hypothetical protein